MHKMSLLHAEKIIGELMECMLDQVKAPVVAHEILGDAMSLYAVDDGSDGLADTILEQLESYFIAFRKREAFLLRECGFCVCDACTSVRQLKLKAILHTGEAAFTQIRDIQKVSGLDVILSHRLLKNTVESNEYILVTKAFSEKCSTSDMTNYVEHVEQCEGVGSVPVLVRNFEAVEVTPQHVSIWTKLKFFLSIERYTASRFFGKKGVEFRNLPSVARN